MNSPARSQRRRRRRIGTTPVAGAALLACAALISGCSSGGLIADHLPAAVGGLPEETPARAPEGSYPAVHNMPPARSTTPLNDDQQKALEDDLVAARNRYGGSPAAASGSGTTANSKAGSAQNP